MIPIDKIKSLLSSDVTSLFSDDILNDAYINAYKTINALMSDEACLDSLFNSGLSADKYQTNHSTWTDNADVVYSKSKFNEGRRLLSVERKNDVGSYVDNIFYQCKRIPSQRGESGIINKSSSIYYENDLFSPKYYINSSGGVIIIPTNEVLGVTQFPKGRVFWLSYPTFEQRIDSFAFNYTFDLAGKNFSEITAEETLFYGMPSEAKSLVYIEMAMNMLHLYMADFVHDEEDVELVALLKEQVTSLLSKKGEELNYVLPKYGNQKERK